MAHLPMGPGREFDAIRALAARWGDAARGLGDDAALLDVPRGQRLVVSTDSSVEDVHFRRAWLRPEEIGWRATMAALSDLAAMGATPLGVLLALNVPADWRDALPALAAGVGEAVRQADTVIVGGDTTGGPVLSLTVTVLGTAAQPLTRAGARVGDAVYVTGVLGGPARALAAWTAGMVPDAVARARFARPEARLGAGRWFAQQGATAAIDLSDGLAADAAHLAQASGVRLQLDLDALPCVAGVDARQAAVSGEEYELLCTASPALDPATAAALLGQPVTRIGRVLEGPPGVAWRDAQGARVEFTGGYDHFSL
jgi:thiamine-monophosphate kinase